MNLQSLGFYGFTIGLVVTLFSVVTAYGEANLKASKPISGDYFFQAKPSGCAAGNSLNLSIQQSGIYVNAALANLAQTKPDQEATLKHRTLQGQWKNQQLTLVGAVPQAALCADLGKRVEKVTLVAVKFQGSVKNTTLSGTLFLNSDQEIAITAQHQSTLLEP